MPYYCLPNPVSEDDVGKHSATSEQKTVQPKYEVIDLKDSEHAATCWI